MAKTILVCGYGPGISNAVTQRFGREGFTVAMVARNAARLAAAAKRLQAAGINAEPFVADLGHPDAARALVQKVRAKIGPIEGSKRQPGPRASMLSPNSPKELEARRLARAENVVALGCQAAATVGRGCARVAPVREKVELRGDRVLPAVRP